MEFVLTSDLFYVPSYQDATSFCMNVFHCFYRKLWWEVEDTKEAG